MLTFTTCLKNNNIYKGCNRVVDENKDGGENRGKGKDKRVCGSYKKNQHEEVWKGLVVLGKSTFEKETKSCAFLWDVLTYNFFEVAPLVCRQWKNVVLIVDKLWQAFPRIFFLGLFIQEKLVWLSDQKSSMCNFFPMAIV